MITRNTSTKKSREFWGVIDEASEIVKKWPQWKRVVHIDDYDEKGETNE